MLEPLTLIKQIKTEKLPYTVKEEKYNNNNSTATSSSSSTSTTHRHPPQTSSIVDLLGEEGVDLAGFTIEDSKTN